MLCFLLSDSEIVAAVQASERRPDGRIAIRIAAARLDSGATVISLTFAALPRTVHSGQLALRLSPIQYALLEYVYTHGKVEFEELQDSVWQRREVSDGAIRAVVSKINSGFADAQFPVELVSYKGRVSLEKVG